MIAIKLIILNALWLLVALKGGDFSHLFIVVFGLIFLFFDFFVFKPKILLTQYLSLSLFFTFYGLVNDYLLQKLGIVIGL